MRKIHPGAWLGGDPEHRDFHAGKVDALTPGWYLGEDVIVNEGVSIHRGIGRPTRIGDRTMLQARAHIAHDVVVGDDCEICANVVLCGHVSVGNGVKIGGNAWVRPFVTIGDGARIGGGSVVIRDVPAGEVHAGNPARRLTSGREAQARGHAGTGADLSVEDYAAKCSEAVGSCPGCGGHRFNHAATCPFPEATRAINEANERLLERRDP